MRIAFLFMILFFCNQLDGQKIKFGKVDLADIVATESILEPEAEAEYLISKCEIKYNFSNDLVLVADYHFRIKIYKEEGEEYANFDLPFYTREKVKYIEAISFNEENGEVVETKLNNKDIYIEETSEKWSVKKFAVPNVKAGTVLDVKYSYTSPYINNIPQWYFQYEIPGSFSEYRIIVPKYFNLTPVPSGTIALDTEKQNYNASQHGEVLYTFSARDIPSIKDDDYALNINDYKSGIRYEISRITYPDGSVENFADSWNNIASKLSESDGFGRMLNKRLKELDYVVNEAKSLEASEKIKHIYNHVINNYIWNKSYGIYAQNGLNKLVKEKTGNIADINLLLINLLRKVDIDATPVVLRSRFSGLLNTSFPSNTELNYIIGLVKIDGKELLLDASSKYIPVGQLPVRATNLNGIIINKDSGSVINLKNPNKYSSQVFCEFELNPEEAALEGLVKFKKSNFAASKSRIESDEDYEEEEDDEDNQDVAGDNEEDEEEKENEDIREIVSVENLEDIYKSINVSYDEKLYSVVRKIGDEIFIDASLDYGIAKNPFDEEERLYPVFYNYLVDLKRVISINIPEGYTVSSIPEKTVLSLIDKEAQFIYEAKEVNNKLLIYYTLKINKDIFYGEQYTSLREFYDIVIAKQEEKIILTKI